MSISSVKVTSIETRRQGFISPVEAEGNQAESLMKKAVSRWASQQEAVAELPWSEVPEEMLFDFLVAATHQIKSLYGTNASMKASEIITISLAQRRVISATLFAPLDSEKNEVCLKFEKLSSPPPSDKPPGVTFEMSAEGDDAKREPAQLLRDWANAPRPPSSTPYTTESSLKPSQARLLVSRVEGLMGDRFSPENQTETLMFAAALCVIHERMVRLNAQASSSVSSGLYEGETEIAPGCTFSMTLSRDTPRPSNEGSIQMTWETSASNPSTTLQSQTSPKAKMR